VPALGPRNSPQIIRSRNSRSQLPHRIDSTMADVATPPAADAPQGKQQIVKPEKPDDDKYKEDLAKAEKEHTAAQDKLVSHTSLSQFSRSTVLAYSMPAGLAQQRGREPAYQAKAYRAHPHRTPARPSSTSPAPITRTPRTASASKSSKPSLMPSARPSRATSQGATPSSSRSRSSTSSSSRALTSSRPARARSTTSRSRMSTRRLPVCRSRSTAA
jgi:hypothetical protein